MITKRLKGDPAVKSVKPLDTGDGETMLQLVMDGRPLTTLADENTLVTELTATGGQGRLVVDVPPYVKVGSIADTVSSTLRTAELVARRQTTRRTPRVGVSPLVSKAFTRFTERQQQSLRVAYDNGNFEWPREAGAAEVADQLGVSTPTFSQHIRAAERKLVSLLFGD